MSEYLIFDINGIFCPIYFVQKEDFINSIYQFINLLINTIAKHPNKKVIFACDKCSNNHRYKILSTYKSLRVKNPQLKASLLKLQEILNIYNLPIEGHDNYEADDIIASYCYNANSSTIIGIDKDFYQLIKPHIKLFHPFKRFFIDKEFVWNKFHVTPDQFALFQALCGDTSDSIPGICKIGPKTAAHIINTCSDKTLFPKLFPKYDFTPLNQMLQLTTLQIFDIQNKEMSSESVLKQLIQLQEDISINKEHISQKTHY